jgi:adenylate kinase family enzyme
VIVMVGSPLSGKGTQSALLSLHLDHLPTVSTGDLFRAEAKTGSALGLKMKSYMDKGELIPVRTAPHTHTHCNSIERHLVFLFIHSKRLPSDVLGRMS